MNGKHCRRWCGGIVMGINTRKSSLKVHYTVNDPHVLLPPQLCAAHWKWKQFSLCSSKKLLALHKKPSSWTKAGNGLKWVSNSATLRRLFLFWLCFLQNLLYTVLPSSIRAFSRFSCKIAILKLLCFSTQKFFHKTRELSSTHTRRRRRRLIEMQYLK